MTNKLKTIDIKGKPYVLVNERMKYFREMFPNHSLVTKIIEMGDGVITMIAEISDPDGRVIATGHAQEKETSSYINKTSYVENCETSAWGRALANFGIGIDESIASYDEVSAAIKAQEMMKNGGKKEAEKSAKNFQETMRTVATATEEQVKEIRELLFALQQPEEPVLKKNNIKSFSEFTEKAAETLILKLKERVG